jgi:nucleoside-diphosphate-sugar epimerase
MGESIAPILVTGATGRHGSTGAHVARRLREEGRPLRDFVRANRAELEVTR